jgi:hypothetical protein
MECRSQTGPDGTSMLIRFTVLLGLGEWRAAFAYRQSLSPQHLKAFQRALRSSWIPSDSHDARDVGESHWVTSFSCAQVDRKEVTRMIRDLSLIAAAHRCSLRADYDARRHEGTLALHNAPEPVRDVVRAWMCGYTRTPYDPGEVC